VCVTAEAPSKRRSASRTGVFVGEPVVAIGSPLGLSFTLTSGSASHRRADFQCLRAEDGGGLSDFAGHALIFPAWVLIVSVYILVTHLAQPGAARLETAEGCPLEL